MTPERQPPPAPYPAAESADLFDYALLRDYAGFVLRAPRRHKLLSVACFLSILILAIVALEVLPRRWQVTASMLAQRSGVMGTLSNPGVNRDWDAPTRAAREVVLRRENIVSLFKQTDFVNRHMAARAPAVRARDWIFEKLGAERTQERIIEDLVDGVETRLWVQVSADAASVNFGFEWSDRDLTYQMVEAAMQSFLEARHASEISSVGETIAVLEEHGTRVQRDIAAMTTQLEEKERRLHIARSPRARPAAPVRAPRDGEVARLDALLTSRRRALADLEDFRQRRLEELQTQLAQQRTIYATQHPTVVSTRQNIESLTSPSPQVDSLRNEIADLEREITRRGGRPGETVIDQPAAQRDEIAEARARLDQDDPRVEYERNQLRMLYRQYSNLLDRIDGARVELETAQAAFKYRYSVITPPQLPRRPTKPNAPLILVASLVAGIAFAFFASATLDVRRGVVVERWQLARKLDLPVLAEIRTK